MNALPSAIFLSAWTSWRAFGARLGIFHTLEGFGKLGRLRLEVMLQGLVPLDKLLELLPNLADSGLLLLALGALLGHFIFDLGQHLLKGRHFGRGPY